MKNAKMMVLVVGEPDRIEEFKTLKIQNAQIKYIEQEKLDRLVADYLDNFSDDEGAAIDAMIDFSDYDVVFDLNLEDNSDNIQLYDGIEDLIVFGCAVGVTMTAMVQAYASDTGNFFGLNAWPTFLGRSVMEVSHLLEQDFEPGKEILDALGITHEWVEDRVGMVSPRIVGMVINEACFVWGEGTSTPLEIDAAMRLGTNYPLGPFEWLDRIGTTQVMNLIDRIHADTHDPRYKLAPMLRALGSNGLSVR